MCNRARKRGGFTIAEVAAVIGIASVLMSIGAAAGLYARRLSSERAAQAAITTLETAIARYEAKRGDLPKDTDGDGVTTAGEIISQLKDWALLGDDFSDLDPWGHKYVVVLKRDYYTSPHTMYDFNFFPINDTPGGMQVYSLGPDGQSGIVDTLPEASDDVSNFPA